MSTIETKPLKILNASAGSGKTYNLVKEYICLLITDEKDFTRFSRIIAMTFTNKASIEMKTRIVKALDELSFPEKYLEKSTEYASKIALELNITVEQVHNRSKKVLQNILHRYEDFFVMTIDKFNLKLIRSFSRDLDLPNDFEVILNETEVIEQVVDLLLNQLGKENLKDLTTIVFEYAKNNLDDGEKWNFRSQLVDFGKILSKEKDQATIEKLMLMDFSIERNKELKTNLKVISDDFISNTKKVYELFESFALDPKMLPGVGNTLRPIERLNNFNSFPDALFTEAFLKNAEAEPQKGKIYPLELRTALLDLQNQYETIAPNYFVQKIFLKNFYNMAMLQYMAKALVTIKKDEQLIRISEFNKLISDLVRNELAPFIYERLGIRFQNFLLDEFQDTSRLQWLNMVPLIRESLSNKSKNLIVGDPKQSIYRFKNGVAEQFVALPAVYNPEEHPTIQDHSNYFESMGHVVSLEENYRSSSTIVEFNNTLFPKIKEMLSDEAKDFYNSIVQNPISKLEGFVDILSVPAEKDNADLVPEIVERIEQCVADGFKLGDICILADLNFKANQWAIDLTKRGYKIVSAESLLVQNEIKVKLIVSYLKRRLNPSSNSEKKRFAELFFRILKIDSFENYRKYLDTGINPDGKKYTYFKEDEFIRDYFGNRTTFFCKFENLYDLIQQFYRMMKWDELQNPYLHHFADFSHEFELSKGPDIKSFLAYYAAQKSKLAIQLPESDDAIKIMTIHKSKGLEFPVVILPYVDFSLDIKGTGKFLIEIDDLIVYTTLSKESPIDEIVNFQSKEKAQILTDKVNQAYVAFTRPMERLYIMNYHNSKGFGKKLHECFSESQGITIHETGEITAQYGTKSQRIVQKEKAASSFFEPKSITENLWFPDISLQDQSSLLENNLLSKERRFGNQFHIAMSLINDKTAIKSTIAQLEQSGEIEIDFVQPISQKIESIFNRTDFDQLFTDALEVLNEQSIILDEKTTKRPDKIILKKNETIILDYKTGIPSAKDEKQISEYITTLQKMEYPNVKGYLFYTALNELKVVN